MFITMRCIPRGSQRRLQLVSAVAQVTIKTADGATILIDPAGATCRSRWRGKVGGVHVSWQRLGMGRTCGAAPCAGPTKGREEAIWRGTVPVARLRCQDTEEGQFDHKEFRKGGPTWTHQGGRVKGPRWWRGCTDRVHGSMSGQFMQGNHVL